MLTRVIVYSIFGIGGLILADIQHDSKTNTNNALYKIKSSSKKGKELQAIFKNISSDLPIIEQIIRRTQVLIKYIFTNYDFSRSGVKNLDNLLMESGGRPLQNIIISTWRSGSTFLGDIINSLPGTYYNYEPLIKFGVTQIRGPPESVKVLNMVKKMLKCDHKNMTDYFEFGKNNNFQFVHNKRLWNLCERRQELCFDANFTSRFCKLFPFQLMKLVRLRLRVAHKLLHDKKLNVKIIFLVRDPRAVMQSRKPLKFCLKSPFCSDPKVLCADMIRDYVEAGFILKQFPHRLFVLRFEELVLKLNTTTLDIFKFLRLSPAVPVQDFLKSHTKFQTNDPFSTYRVSRDVPYNWTNTLNFTEVDKIQKVCAAAMNLWGYQIAHNATHMASKGFNPLLNFTINSSVIKDIKI